MKAERLALVLALAAIGVSLAVWYRVTDEVRVIRDSQRMLAADLAKATRAPVIDLTGAPALGPDTARVTVVEFSDYECPFCLKYFQQTLPQIEEHYIRTGKIRYVFRDFPVDELHPDAIRAHEAAHCAGEQGKFWQLHVKLFSKPGSHTPEQIAARASEAGLSADRFTACVGAGQYTDSIRASAKEAARLGADGTPAFFVGIRDLATNQLRIVQAMTGAHPYETFAKVIDAVLQQQ
jgi:protein-disulfide isomerase